MKWLVLGAYSLVAGLSQLLWLNFAPIIPAIQSRYGVTETEASLLILVFPLVYVILAIPFGAYIDKVGYRKGIGVGVITMTAFTLLRIVDCGFALLLICQIGIAVAQPLIINGISKLVLDWFPQEQSVIATGIGTMGMFIGMALGMASTPPLIETLGFQGAMAGFGLFTFLSAVVYFVSVKNNPSQTRIIKDSSEPQSFRDLFRDKNLVLLFILCFLGLGFFNGLTTWLELILSPHGINSAQAGLAGGILIVGGIVGAGVIPAVSEHFKKRKPFLMGSILVASLTLYPLCGGKTFTQILIFSAIQGFFFLPAFSLLLEMCSELVGEIRAASATGILMLAGNLGGVIVVLAMEWVKKGQDFSPSVNLLFILLLISLGLSALLPETKKKI